MALSFYFKFIKYIINHSPCHPNIKSKAFFRPFYRGRFWHKERHEPWFKIG